jgi:hypothetical protein
MIRARAKHVRRRGRLAATVALAILLASVSAPALAATLSVKDRARLKLVGSRENTLIETGKATGTLPGTVKVYFTLHGVHATSRFTIYAKGGAISGVGTGTVKSGKTGYDSFGGTLKLTGGSGRFGHAHGSGGLYGSLYKLDESINVQVDGTLHYD